MRPEHTVLHQPVPRKAVHVPWAGQLQIKQHDRSPAAVVRALEPADSEGRSASNVAQAAGVRALDAKTADLHNPLSAKIDANFFVGALEAAEAVFGLDDRVSSAKARHLIA